MLTTPARPRESAPPAATRLSAGTPPGSGRDSATAASAALGFLVFVSALGLVRVFTNHDWFGPVILTIVALECVCWLTRRLRMPLLAALVVQLVASFLLLSWTVVGYSTSFGIPTGRTVSAISGGLTEARSDFSSAITPVLTTVGFKLLAVIGVILVVILGDWAAFRWRSALYAAAAPFALFVACCALGAGAGRLWMVTAEVAGLLLFLLVHRASVERADQAWFGNYRARTTSWALVAGSGAAIAALVAAVLVTPALNGTEGKGVLGWRGGVGSDNSGPRQVPNPVVDLHTRIINESSVPVFSVQSPVPSYWRLTSLDTFTGQDWISTDSYRNIGARLPGAQSVPPGTRTVEETFNVQQLESVWLPDAFTPYAISGVKGVSYDPVSGSLITSKSTSDAMTYTVDAYQYLSSLNPTQLRQAPSVSVDSSLRRYVELPSDIPASVYQLAADITKNETTEYDKALALQNFFRSPSFRYSLYPPDDGYGIDALTNFLFVTREGYCQQFAGAYAVLARAIGLPTRLAVGFATGTSLGQGAYQVTDADAHTWPEVYFGPQYGWLPFEPTQGFDNPSSKSYAAPSSAGSASGPAGAAGDQQSQAPKTGLKQTPKTGSSSATTVPSGSRSASAGSHHGVAAWTVLLIVLLIGVGWFALVIGFRRGRWWLRRWRARDNPAALVLARWEEVGELLAWWDITRYRDETDEEFGLRAGRMIAKRMPNPSQWLPGGVLRLAVIAAEAAFAPRVDADRPNEASMIAVEIHQRLIRGANARMILRWMLVPRPGWHSIARDRPPATGFARRPRVAGA